MEYGTTANLGLSKGSGSGADLEHAVVLDGLQAATLYHLVAVSQDNEENRARLDAGQHSTGGPDAPRLDGELTLWHPLTLTLVGPVAAEADASPNPFLDYSMGVDFVSPTGTVIAVPGYFAGDGSGGANAGDDLTLEDFRTRQEMLDFAAGARSFLESFVPFWEMEPSDDLLSGASSDYGGGEVFAKHDEVYVIYLPKADRIASLDLTGTTGSFNQYWFNPRTGLFEGAVATVQGGDLVSLGAPPRAYRATRATPTTIGTATTSSTNPAWAC